MILTELTQLEAPAEQRSTFRVTRFLAALALLNSYAAWSDEIRADFLRTVRTMIDTKDSVHWARLLDDGAMPDPGDSRWADWYTRAVDELHRAYHALPRYAEHRPSVTHERPLPVVREVRIVDHP